MPSDRLRWVSQIRDDFQGVELIGRTDGPRPVVWQFVNDTIHEVPCRYDSQIGLTF